jgi:hypothetical protein
MNSQELKTSLPLKTLMSLASLKLSEIANTPHRGIASRNTTAESTPHRGDAFIAVCESARSKTPPTVALLRSAALLGCGLNNISTATRRINCMDASVPCAFAHGYKHDATMWHDGNAGKMFIQITQNKSIFNQTYFFIN